MSNSGPSDHLVDCIVVCGNKEVSLTSHILHRSWKVRSYTSCELAQYTSETLRRRLCERIRQRVTFTGTNGTQIKHYLVSILLAMWIREVNNLLPHFVPAVMLRVLIRIDQTLLYVQPPNANKINVFKNVFDSNSDKKQFIMPLLIS